MLIYYNEWNINNLSNYVIKLSDDAIPKPMPKCLIGICYYYYF